LERAQAAQQRGELRRAQIELRNAVRTQPGDAALRAALAETSLEVGDGDTAEKEARAALERGYDRVAGTRLLLRAYLMLNRAHDLLREFPPREEPAAVGGQVAAARALAQLALGQREAARQSAADAVRLAPQAAESHLAASSVAMAEGDATAAEAAADRALASRPGSTEAVLRKATLTLGRGDAVAAVDLLGSLLAREPGSVPARVMRAEALLRLNREADARLDLDTALRTQPNNAAASYLRAVLLMRAQDWQAANDVLQRLGSAVGRFPDGFLLAATVKRAVGQLAQAEDMAQRHVSRRPNDPRGAKLLATLELEGNRPDAAAATLTRLVDRGSADAEALDMLGRAYVAAGRPREAVAAFDRAATLAPGNSAVLSRLEAARLTLNDIPGSGQAARRTLEGAPTQTRAWETMTAALARGDFAAAEAELNQLSRDARGAEPIGVLEGAILLGRLDFDGARATFEAVLNSHPESVAARLGLARALSYREDPSAVERVLREVLEREPNNSEALNRLVALAAPGSERAASARAVLEAARAAAPAALGPAQALATVLARHGDAAGAIQLLDSEPLRRTGLGPAMPLLRAQLHLSLQQWRQAEAAAQAALVEEPTNISARRLLSELLVRGGDQRGAEDAIREGLRLQPTNLVLQQALVRLALETHGLDAALALADRMSRDPAAQPESRLLRGDVLLSQRRSEDAARAFAAAYAEAPSAVLALRQAAAWLAAGQEATAVAALHDWLRRAPESIEALDLLAQIDLGAGRLQEAEQRLELVLKHRPTDVMALNNLAWILGERSATRVRARELAGRAFFLAPSAETADTLGWIMARLGESQRAVPLLRAAAVEPREGAHQGPDPVKAYHLAWALRAAGNSDEAVRVLEPILSGGSAFPERKEAEHLLAELRGRR
jgi:putative PEP-CTERM system TPR-repeat lipoprotein